MKDAISNLEAAIQHIKNNDRKAAAQQAEYAHSKLDPKAFGPSPRCKCWGVIVKTKNETTVHKNKTLAQANRLFDTTVENITDMTGLWVVAFHSGIERVSLPVTTPWGQDS